MKAHNRMPIRDCLFILSGICFRFRYALSASAGDIVPRRFVRLASNKPSRHYLDAMMDARIHITPLYEGNPFMSMTKFKNLFLQL